MEITTLYVQRIKAADVRLADPIDSTSALTGLIRTIYIGDLGLITSARNDDSAGWLDAADAAGKLAEAAEGMQRWALAQAESADDLKAQRETAAQARRVADFGDLTQTHNDTGCATGGYLSTGCAGYTLRGGKCPCSCHSTSSAMSSAPERDKGTGLGRDSMDSADPYSVAFAFGAGR